MTTIHAENITDSNSTSIETPTKSYSDLNDRLDNLSDDVLVINESYQYNPISDNESVDGVRISRNITIIGENNSYIDGSNVARCLFIESHCSVVLENLIFKRGYSNDSGGAIFLNPYSKLIIKNCTFQKNTVYNSDGGAINGEEGTYVEIHNSAFFNNTSKRVSDLEWEEFKKGMGSVICMRIGSTLKLYDSIVRDNRGYLTTILVITFDDVKIKQSELYVKNCLFENNKATSSGVIYLDEFGKGEILDSVFRNNVVTKRSGTVILDATVSALVKNCSFEGNSAIKGGAIFIKIFKEEFEADVTIKDCNFTDNYASLYGGAIYAKSGITKISNCNFVGNKAGTHGGAIASLLGTLKISNSYFSQNDAPTGGGLYLKSDNLVLSSIDFVKNTASNMGGAVYSKTTKLTLSKLTYNGNAAKYADDVYGVFLVKVIKYSYKSGKSKLKITISSPWGMSLSQKIKVSFGKYTSKWYKTNSKGKVTIKLPKKAKVKKKSFKIAMKNGFGKLKSWNNKVSGKLKTNKTVKKPSKIEVKVVSKANGKAIKNKKFNVKVYTKKTYKNLKLKTNSKGIFKISTKKLQKGKHKITVYLATKKYDINCKVNVRIK
jgi:predicted outer membrane repeat protein